VRDRVWVEKEGLQEKNITLIKYVPGSRREFYGVQNNNKKRRKNEAKTSNNDRMEVRLFRVSHEVTSNNGVSKNGTN